MKKVKKSLLAVLLGLPLVIAFASCDKLSNDEELLLGNWEYQSIDVVRTGTDSDTSFTETGGYALYRDLQFNEDRTAKVEIMNAAEIYPPIYDASEFTWNLENKGETLTLSNKDWGTVSWKVIILSYNTLKFQVNERYYNGGTMKSTYTYQHTRRSNSRPN